MAKGRSFKPRIANSLKPSIPIREREDLPQMKKTDKGIAIFCPFCILTHPLVPGKVSPCGTVLKLTAVQQIVRAHIADRERITCLKCHKIGGGDMVPWQGGFVHAKECDPTTKLFLEPPVLSSYAKFVFGLPEKLRPVFSGKRGMPQAVHW